MSDPIPQSSKLRIGWHREHFLSPLLQFHAKDAGSTFELVECPGGTGEMQVKLKNGEIDVCIGASCAYCFRGAGALLVLVWYFIG
jgi:hypothetical protein